MPDLDVAQRLRPKDIFDTRFLRNPRQANTVHSTGRYLGKQHHQFIVKFMMNGMQVGANMETIKNLTFVAKMVDRPKIDPKTEELHQYNKRRQIYTGIKYQPVRIQFYDDAHGRAQAMWQDYSAYYFADFVNNANAAYEYDVTSTKFDNGTGFGLIVGAGSGQFYFHEIMIYHLYDNMMDQYTLTNPRISLFEPDDLDYESSTASMISMTVVYENLQYKLQVPTNTVQDDEIFARGKPFDGDVVEVPDTGAPREYTYLNTQRQGQVKRSQSRVQFGPPSYTSRRDGESEQSTSPALQFGPAQQATRRTAPAVGRIPPAADYRYNGTPSTGSLGMFGDFQFGPADPGNLGQMALNNFPLSAALNMGVPGNPLTLNNVSMAGAANASSRGMDGATYDVSLARAAQQSTGYGNMIEEVIAGTMASTAIRSDRSMGTPTGIVLTPEGYGVMNSRQSGTAQFGFNPNTAPDGSSWGYTGPAGFQGPYNYYNDGPYVPDRPSGLYGRAGIEPKPLPE